MNLLGIFADTSNNLFYRMWKFSTIDKFNLGIMYKYE